MGSARVEANADVHRAYREGLCDCFGGSHGSYCRGESEKERVALCIDLDAVFCRTGIAYHAPMHLQCFGVGHSP